MTAITLDACFKTFDGEENLVHKEEDFTLRAAIIESLLGVGSDSQMTGEAKASRFNLARKVKLAGEEVELSLPEIQEIRGTIGSAYATIVVGQAFEMLPLPEVQKVVPLKAVK